MKQRLYRRGTSRQYGRHHLKLFSNTGQVGFVQIHFTFAHTDISIRVIIKWNPHLGLFQPLP